MKTYPFFQLEKFSFLTNWLLMFHFSCSWRYLSLNFYSFLHINHSSFTLSFWYFLYLWICRSFAPPIWLVLLQKKQWLGSLCVWLLFIVSLWKGLEWCMSPGASYVPPERIVVCFTDPETPPVQGKFKLELKHACFQHMIWLRNPYYICVTPLVTPFKGLFPHLPSLLQVMGNVVALIWGYRTQVYPSFPLPYC